MTYAIQELCNYHCACGENPLWDERRKLLFWEDIPAGRLFRYDPATGRHECFRTGPAVGGFTFQEDGSLLLFGANRISLLRPDGREEPVAEGIDPEMDRFNDVTADPEGRVFAGTMGRDNKGGLYRLDPDGRCQCLFKGTGCSNGMGFSPDLRRFYWTDSTARVMYVFDYDRATGRIDRRREFYVCPEGEGTPDGMTVDAEGYVWSARWDGHAVCRHAPDGALLEKIAFPVAKVSSVIFGGEGLDELYLTTAGGKSDSPTADGALYRLKVPARGRCDFRSRVKTE